MRLLRRLFSKRCPDQFEGVLTLCYPPGHSGQPTSGWQGVFATPDGQMVTTVARAVIYSDPEWPVWAELTMFTTTAGRPALDIPRAKASPAVFDLAGIARKRNGEFRTRTFRYLIEFVAERPAAAVPATG